VRIAAIRLAQSEVKKQRGHRFSEEPFSSAESEGEVCGSGGVGPSTLFHASNRTWPTQPEPRTSPSLSADYMSGVTPFTSR